MKVFRYRAVGRDGKVSEGVAEAGSRAEAIRRLNAQGLQPISVEEKAASRDPAVEAGGGGAGAGTKADRNPEPKPPRAPGGTRLSSRQLIQFTEELSDLLSAGVQLDPALQAIAKRSESDAIRSVASLCHAKVRDGTPLASAMRTASPSFDDLYCNLVVAGEVSGALGEILKRQVRYLTTLSELRAKLATAMVYPAFLVVSSLGVAGMFTFFLVPRLRRLVESTGGELPPVVRLFLGAGDFFGAHWVLLAGIAALIALAVAILFQRESVKYGWDEAKLKIPLFGKLSRARFNVQFVETLSNLLVNGLPLVKALKLAEGTTRNRYLRRRISDISEKVSEGVLLCASMEKAGVFEPGLIDMTRIGEDTGNLANSLAKAGERLDRELGRAVERLATVLQPAIILVMAGLVGVMAYMMISVIYETISVLRNRG